MAKRRDRPGEELSAPRLALRALTELRPSLDRLEAALVDQARLGEVTWELIAADLGVTKQTAHRRHGSHDPLAARRPRAEVPREIARLTEGLEDDDGRLARLLMQELDHQRAKGAE